MATQDLHTTMMATMDREGTTTMQNMTHILLYIETADRPGLLMEIIQIINDTNISVESAEIDTEGLVAKDKFHVSYRGAALNNSLSQVLTNSLRYSLRRPDTDEDSY
ncbi:ACT domain-containing protein ACR12-like protein [Cinnamomum micranthum f. kanehirae]|uniref:ACT domain-containing protein ACR n=1 Tax=Cinnamomum micranthum f. kanehirae TaxID=337451 RepID=A0A443NYE5_9MAGN|nr:ACT domain-containing protein ACR12-like protein [Cinnamomum micranthum f. kanehirae]